jgi:phage N-6-adenine-methyltransferase
MTMPKQNPGRSRQDYSTPKEFISAVKHRLKIQEFTADLAADMFNTKAAFFWGEEDNSLIQDWHVWGPEQWLFLNPPFSNISPWVEKCATESHLGCNIVCLVPASVGANWWREWVTPYAYTVFLNGRLTFSGETTPYPKDCSLLLYTPWGFPGSEVWTWKGTLPEGMFI